MRSYRLISLAHLLPLSHLCWSSHLMSPVPRHQRAAPGRTPRAIVCAPSQSWRRERPFPRPLARLHWLIIFGKTSPPSNLTEAHGYTFRMYPRIIALVPSQPLSMSARNRRVQVLVPVDRCRPFRAACLCSLSSAWVLISWIYPRLP